jgi:hypothetical protein
VIRIERLNETPSDNFDRTVRPARQTPQALEKIMLQVAWRAAAVSFALALPGLAFGGDFGRPSPSLLDGLIPRQFWKGPVTGYSSFPITDLEEQLRDRSYALIRPNEPRGSWNIYIAGFQLAHLFRPPSRTTTTPNMRVCCCGRRAARKRRSITA